ncbi:hypothetical protein EUTSA_v10019697mg, partial [Eutrema salsugineum]
MAPKRNPQHQQDVRNEESVNEWAELRRTLLAMQENIQATITTSIQELAETVLNHREQHRQQQSSQGSDEESVDSRVNPFARDQQRRQRVGDRGFDRGDRNWESSFKVEIPEFHGGARGDELLDWLVAVDEAMEFKHVPEDRKVALVATKFRGRAASWWMQLKSTRSRT